MNLCFDIADSNDLMRQNDILDQLEEKRPKCPSLVTPSVRSIFACLHTGGAILQIHFPLSRTYAAVDRAAGRVLASHGADISSTNRNEASDPINDRMLDWR